MIKYWEASWTDLDSYVNSVRSINSSWDLWTLLDREPLTVESIDFLVAEGWRLEEHGLSAYHGLCMLRTKLIQINSNLSAYERDKTLFHELAHAWYSKFGILLNGIVSPVEEIITEWIARGLRATPKLLRQAVLTFGLEPFIYDSASHQAFHVPPAESQLSFQFYNPKIDLELLMD